MLLGFIVAIAALRALSLTTVDCYGLAEGSFLRLVLLQLTVFVEEQVNLLSLQGFPLAALTAI